MVSALALLACAALVAARLPQSEEPHFGRRTLVLVQRLRDRSSYSLFLGDLEERGHVVEVAESGSGPALVEYGELRYDNVVHLAAAEPRASVSATALLEFVQKGGNVLAAASSASGVPAAAAVPTALREFAAEVGVDFAPSGTQVRDDSEDAALASDPRHTRVFVRGVPAERAVFGDDSGAEVGEAPAEGSKKVAFAGTALEPSKNVLSLPLLRGFGSTYAVGGAEGAVDRVGEALTLVAGVQGRNNNARVVLSGSVWLLSDEAFSEAGSWNREFARHVSRWAFQERGVLRLRNVSHSRSDGSPPELMMARKQRPDLPRSMFPEPEIDPSSQVYRIKDELRWSAVIERFNGREWVPFSQADPQLEFAMLDAYERRNVEHVGNGRYVVDFTAPDAYGVFKFRLLFRRPGLTVLHDERSVVVRPFRHNEYPRFLQQAAPYYTTILALALYVWLFAFLFIYTAPARHVEQDRPKEKSA